LEPVATLLEARNLSLYLRQGCDRVVVLSHGEIVERGTTRALIETPQHAYTRRLLQAVPRL
jgi:peptide/nickel transport system ATP-binding protein